MLQQYDGTVLLTRSEIYVKIQKNEQEAVGQFIVVENADRKLPLLGRDWLHQLQLYWPKMLKQSRGQDDPRVHTLHSAEWTKESPKVTKEGLGTLKDIKAEVKLQEGVTP